MPTMRWQDHTQSGDHASLPSASTTAVGALYSCSDHGKIYVSDGVSAWSDWQDPANAVDLAAHEADTTSAHTAEGVAVVDSGALYASTNVETALAEVMGALDTDEQNLADHEAAATDAHDASAISVLDTATKFTATEVESALEELYDADHAEDHASRHSDGGADEVTVENLATAATDTSYALKPDGAGGLAFGAVGGSITVEEEDGTPSVASVSTIKVTNGALTDNGSGSVSIDVGGGGGSALTVTDESGTVSDTAVTSITVPDGTLVDDGAGLVTLRQVPTGVVGCLVSDTGQVVSTNTWTSVDYSGGTEWWDSDGFTSLGTDFTVPAGFGGRYLVIVDLMWDSDSGGDAGSRYLKFAINGSSTQGEQNFRREGASVDHTLSRSAVLDLVAGDVVTVSVYQDSGGNVTIDGTKFQMVKLGSGTVGEAIGAKVYKTSYQNNLTASTWSKVTFDTAEFDTDSFFDDGNDRLTIPAGLGGKYIVSGIIALESGTSAGGIGSIYKNGTIAEYITRGALTAAVDDYSSFAVVMDLAAGEYIEMFVNPGGASTVDVRGAQGFTSLGLTLLATQGVSKESSLGAVFYSPATNDQQWVRVPFACRITGGSVMADVSGSCVVDVWVDTWANYPPTDADSITASAPLTISSATKSEDTTLTGWTRDLSKGDVLVFNVDSATTVAQVTVQLDVRAS